MENREFSCIMLAVLFYRQQENTSIFLGRAQDVSKFPVMAKGKIKEVMNFLARKTADTLGTQPFHGAWNDDINYLVHGYKANNLCLIAITTDNYPSTTAERVLVQLMKDIQIRLPTNWQNTITDSELINVQGDLMVFNQVKQSNIELLQQELQETKNIVTQNLQQILSRKGKLQEIVDESEDLSNMAKIFVKETKKLKKCRFCSFM